MSPVAPALQADSLLLSHQGSPQATAAAAKSLQSCPTLCDPIDGSPPGSSVRGILQANAVLDGRYNSFCVRVAHRVVGQPDNSPGPLKAGMAFLFAAEGEGRLRGHLLSTVGKRRQERTRGKLHSEKHLK